jgi:hypothetical protein
LELESMGFDGQTSFGPPDHSKLPYSWTVTRRPGRGPIAPAL